MKENELRIGNLVFMTSKNKYYEIDRGQDIDNSEDFEPIQITEEILFKCGFEKLTTKSEQGYNASSYSYRRGYSLIVCLDDGILSVSFWQGNEKKYLHQLQNLFFALTNEELEITL